MAAEFDHRYSLRPPSAAMGGTAADYATNRAALNDALGPGRLDGATAADPDKWGAHGRDIDQLAGFNV
ncbi:hypothetical protein [Streptomyces griseocarneus]|uniref:hypothetical protein n=1 Tax=Streptomyces griseocarneus TaxID=51201 RepID=UPI00167CACD0|nr:hypothetical protein [Streptomyces griseocarneus]MBZ6476496.1 hypothetical protein [Streptomyces griseocarneus]GHG78605.1 hypothetical protein GCM10018779_58500 [Streptomyces griseocarneus]